MCRPATCQTCAKTTWAGCGQHVAHVKRSVPADHWCSGSHTPAEIAAAAATKKDTGGGFLARLFGR